MCPRFAIELVDLAVFVPTRAHPSGQPTMPAQSSRSEPEAFTREAT